MKQKLTRTEFDRLMWQYNASNPKMADEPGLSGIIVFKASNWPEEVYNETQRSYRVWNCNRAYQSGKIAHSLYGDCLDGTDNGVRLDWYNWETEFCYMD